jgi:hypothetical protein
MALPHPGRDPRGRLAHIWGCRNIDRLWKGRRFWEERRRTNAYTRLAIAEVLADEGAPVSRLLRIPEVRQFLQVMPMTDMSPLSTVLREYAFSDPSSAAAHTTAEHVAIGARIADWRALNNRIKFLSMVAEHITFLGVLRNEGVTLTLQPGDRFTSDPKVLADDIKGWIVDNRQAIVAELKNNLHVADRSDT